MTICSNLGLMRQINGLNMNILECAKAVLGTDWHWQNVTSHFSRIYCITNGNGTVSCRGHKTDLTPGTICIVPAGLNFSYNCDDRLEKIYFHITLPKPNNYDLFHGVRKFIVLKDKHKAIKSLSECFGQSSFCSAASVKEILWNIVAEGAALAGIGSEEFTEYSPDVKKIISYIENNLNSGLGVSRISRDLFFSPSFIISRFKKEVGVPVGKYISDRILTEAELKLRLTDMSVKDVSDFFGFCDQFYFSRVFTKFYGSSPREYRKKVILRLR